MNYKTLFLISCTIMASEACSRKPVQAKKTEAKKPASTVQPGVGGGGYSGGDSGQNTGNNGGNGSNSTGNSGTTPTTPSTQQPNTTTPNTTTPNTTTPGQNTGGNGNGNGNGNVTPPSNQTTPPGAGNTPPQQSLGTDLMKPETVNWDGIENVIYDGAFKIK